MRLARHALALLALAATASPLAAGERVLVPSRTIYPGETVTASALQELELLEGKVPPPNAATKLDALEGKVARRTLLAGRYVNVAALREPFLIDKGTPVEMIFQSGPLTISASAVSLESGAAGDMVKVRNVDSGKIVSGTIMADGTVRVSDK